MALQLNYYGVHKADLVHKLNESFSNIGLNPLLIETLKLSFSTTNMSDDHLIPSEGDLNCEKMIFSFCHLSDAGFFVEYCELMVHSSPLLTVLCTLKFGTLR